MVGFSGGDETPFAVNFVAHPVDGTQLQAQDPEDGAVVRPDQDQTALVSHAHAIRRLGGFFDDGQRVDGNGHGPRDAHQGRERVAAVVRGRNPVSPVVQAWGDAQSPVFLGCVVVFAFGVGDVSDLSATVEPAQFLVCRGEGVVFGEHVDAAACFHRSAQRNAFGERLARGGFAHHVFFRLKRLDCEGRVLVAVVRQDDRVHFMF